MMRFILAGILVLMALAFGIYSFNWYRGPSGGQPYGNPFTLTDQRGEEITQAAFRGHPSAVFFGFTHCPEVCPTTLFEMDGWLKALGEEGEDIRAFFVTVDPERDTAEVLDAYVGNVSDRITGITGTPRDIAAMAKSFGIFVRKVDLEGGDYTIDHTASVLLLDKTGDFFGSIAYAENPDTALAKLKRLANGA